MTYDIVIIPPASFRDKIGSKMVRATKRLKTGYIIDNKKLIPHISFFHLVLSKRKLPRLKQMVKAILAGHRPFRMRVLKFESKDDGLYFWFRCGDSRGFRKLHEEIVKKCAPIREGAIRWTSKKKPTALVSRYRKEYGSSYIFDCLTPHITMGRLKNPGNGDALLNQFKGVSTSFLVRDVSVCEVNENHQVTKIIKTFKLK